MRITILFALWTMTQPCVFTQTESINPELFWLDDDFHKFYSNEDNYTIIFYYSDSIFVLEYQCRVGIIIQAGGLEIDSNGIATIHADSVLTERVCSLNAGSIMQWRCYPDFDPQRLNDVNISVNEVRFGLKRRDNPLVIHKYILHKED
jgi:hypothetical protein